MIIDYRTASDYLGRKPDRPLTGRATRIIRRSETSIAIRYQSTDVVTYHDNGTIILDSGGWQTVTTKARMNDYTRARIYQHKGIWYFAPTSWETPRAQHALYYDGIQIDSEGLPREPRYAAKTEQDAKRTLDKTVSAYIAGFAADIVANGLSNPADSDCWGCLFQVQNPETKSPHGRVEPMGLDHYAQHFEDKYYVPSLLLNAIVARGYREPGFIWHLIQSTKDGNMAADILRGYFRKLKPELLKHISA